jgi:hypothetical protein
MKSRGIDQQLSAMRALIKSTSGATGADFELQAHWARYVCVLAAGLLENALVSFYSEFIGRNAQMRFRRIRHCSCFAVKNAP